MFGGEGADTARLEEYVNVGRERLRCGYTTGTCAAAAAAGAAALLLRGEVLPAVELQTPAGIPVRPELLNHTAGPGWASCAVEKDGGDDPDVTHGALVLVCVERLAVPGRIEIDGGEGVGRVTRPGLDQPVGEAAINSTPRRMIGGQLRKALAASDWTGGLRAVVSVPGGEALAAKTFNPRLGIVGGISILGTSGIVRPMSEAALVDSVKLELNALRASGAEDVLITPGNYGEAFCQNVLGLRLDRWCLCSNYLGEAIDHAAGLGFRTVLLVGHLGKLCKAAAGNMNTHSKVSDARREVLTAHAALCGGERPLLQELFASPTTDAAVELLTAAGLREPVMDALGRALEGQLQRRAGPELRIEALFFSNQYGILGSTPGAEDLLALHRAEEE